jgi:TrmH family RNA methyltransferase
VLVEGTRLVGAASDAGVVFDTVFAVDPGSAVEHGVDPAVVVACDDRVIGHVAATAHPQGLVAVARWRPGRDLPAADAATAGVLVLDGVADPGNVGTLVRTAAALGCGAVVTTRGSCDVTNPKALRASAGAAFRIPVHVHLPANDVVAWARSVGAVSFAAVAHDGEPPHRPDGPWTLWIGSEAHGLSPERVAELGRVVTIPVAAGVESLNAAAAGAVLVAACRGVLAPPAH